MSDIDELSARLRRLEDERDIARLIASYGPAVDAGDAEATAGLWASDGSYDVDGWRMEGRAAVHAMVESSAHQKLVAKGCCHFLGPCVVTVTGDSAVAVCESLVLIRDGDAIAYGVAPRTISCCSGSVGNGGSVRAPAGFWTAIPPPTRCSPRA